MIIRKRFCDFCGDEIKDGGRFRTIVWRSEHVNSPKDLCIKCWRTIEKALEMLFQQEDEA